MERYEQGKEQALAKESQDLTEDQIASIIIPVVSQLLSEKTERLSVGKMRAFLKQEEGIILSDFKTRQIKDNIEATHPELFNSD